MITDKELDKFCNGMTDEQFELRKDALINDIETKKNFVEDIIDETHLWGFLEYEVFKGDSDKMYETLADYFNQDYSDYCEDIISSWFNEE